MDSVKMLTKQGRFGWWNNLKVGTKIILSNVVALMLMSATACVLLWQMDSMTKRFIDLIQYDQPAIVNAIQLEKLVVDMETGERGYLITGQEEFLEPYRTGLTEFNSIMKVEEGLVHDNPTQAARLKEIKELHQQWIQAAAIPVIAKRREFNEANASAITLQKILSGEAGKKQIDQIHNILNKMKASLRKKQDSTSLHLVMKIDNDMTNSTTGQQSFLLDGKESFLKQYQDGQIQLSNDIVAFRNRLPNDSENLSRLAQVESLVSSWKAEAGEPAINARLQMNINPAAMEEVIALIKAGTGKKILDQVRAKFTAFIKEEESRNALQFAATRAQGAFTSIPILALFFGSISIGLAMCIVIAKSFSKSLTKITNAAANVAAGKLDETLEVAGGGEIGKLAIAFNAMVASLHQAETRQLRSLSRLERINLLQEELIRPISLKAKFKKITEAATELLDLDFCRVWMTAPSDLCEDGCVHAKVTEGSHVCYNRKKCLHLVSSSGRYTHTDGDHRRVPLGCYKIGRIATGADAKFLTNHVTTDPKVHHHDWAKKLELVSFAGYKLRDEEGEPIGVLAMFSKHRITPEDDAFLANLAETTSEIIMSAQAEDRLRQATEAAGIANLAKSEFLANMSHEIRTPMTAILGFSDILIEDIEGEELLEAACTIKRNGEYLIGIINDILDLSKIEAGKLEIENTVCSPIQIAGEVVSLMRVRATDKNLPLTVEYDGLIPEAIRSDQTRLRQILINLVGNAIKFCDVGKIQLKVRFLDSQSGDPQMQFEVIDTGIGMTEEQMSKLFKPFSQVDTSKARRDSGTGLGLTISKRLAEKLGGDIVVDSTLWRGSNFTLTVSTGSLENVTLLDKTSEAQIETLPHEKHEKEGLKFGCNILFAEDGPDNQRLISHLLNRAGAKVTVAENGGIAYDLAVAARQEGNPFDVILMDMQMPVLSGYDATTKLRESGYGGPVIALTAHAMSTDRQKCIDAGCDDYITKPVTQEELITLINQYLSNQKTTVQ